MRTPLYQLDAFTTRRFAGNPAAVMPLAAFPDDATMQAIAAENNLAETAFLVRMDDAADGDYRLRWFTPGAEVPLCGHATLASAAVVMERLEPGRERVVFRTASGPLTVRRDGTAYVMDFPARPSTEIAPLPALAEALGAVPYETHANDFNLMAVFDDPRTVRELVPDFAALARFDRSGVVVTAAGDEGFDADFDFVSRYFAPAIGVPEDPVTGSTHCMLVPYWAARTGKDRFRAFQASRRGGEIACRLLGDRVELEGHCVFYLEGEAEI